MDTEIQAKECVTKLNHKPNLCCWSNPFIALKTDLWNQDGLELPQQQQIFTFTTFIDFVSFPHKGQSTETMIT